MHQAALFNGNDSQNPSWKDKVALHAGSGKNQVAAVLIASSVWTLGIGGGD
jgi:hypothetical protein